MGRAIAILLLLGGCVGQVYGPAPGVQPQLAVYDAHRACLPVIIADIKAKPQPPTIGVLPTMAWMGTREGREWTSDRVEQECMGQYGWVKK